MSDIQHTFWVFTLINLSDTEKFLCIKRSEYKDRNPLHRDIPWWWLEIWEQMQQSAIRECAEEVGLDTDGSLTFLWTRSRRTNADHTRWSTVLFYTADTAIENVTLSDEHTEYKRLTLDEIMKLELRADVLDEAVRLYKLTPALPK